MTPQSRLSWLNVLFLQENEFWLESNVGPICDLNFWISSEAYMLKFSGMWMALSLVKCYGGNLNFSSYLSVKLAVTLLLVSSWNFGLKVIGCYQELMIDEALGHLNDFLSTTGWRKLIAGMSWRLYFYFYLLMMGLLKPSANDWWSLGWSFYFIQKCTCWNLGLMIDEALVICYVIFVIFWSIL